MMNKVIFVLLLVASIVGSIAYQRKVTRDLMNRLYKYKKERNRQAFMEQADSPIMKIVFSKFNVELMKLNYDLDFGNYNNAKNQFEKFNGMRLNNQNKIALNLRMFHAALEAKDYSLASAIKDSLIPLLKKQQDQQSKLLLGEVIQLDRIYLQKDVSLIDELKQALEESEDDVIKNLLCFRIAKLYHFSHDEERVDFYLKKALSYAVNEENKRSLKALIKNHEGLN